MGGEEETNPGLKDQIFEGCIAALSVADAQGVMTEVNQAFLDMWRYPSFKDAVGVPVADYFLNKEEALDVLAALGSTGRWEGEFLARRFDGSTFVSQGHATAMRDDRGTIIGYHSANIDVTEQRRAEQALAASEERIRGFMNEATDAFVLFDRDLRLVDINPVAVETLAFGRDASELWGRHIDEAGLSIGDPPYRDRLEQVLRGGEPRSFDVDLEHPTRGHRTLSVKAFAVGEGMGIIASDISDISNAKARIAYLNTLLDAVRKVDQLIMQERNTKILLARTCETLVDTLGYFGAWVFVTGHRGARSMLAQAGWKPGSGPTEARWDGPPPCASKARAMEHGLMTIEPRISCADCLLSHEVGHNLSLVAALRVDGEDLGTLGVHFRKEAQATDEEKSLFRELADDLAFALKERKTVRQRDQYAQIVRSSQEGMALVDADHVVMDANPSFARLVDHPFDRVVGRHLRELIGESSYDARVREHLVSTLGGEGRRFEVRLPRHAAGPRILDVLCSPCREQGGLGSPAAALCLRDQTDLRDLQAKIAQSERLNTMGLLAAGITHEINNPLTYALHNLESIHEDLAKFIESMNPSDETLGSVPSRAAPAFPEQREIGPAAYHDLLERSRMALEGAVRVRDTMRRLGRFARTDREEVRPVDLHEVIEFATKLAGNETRFRARMVKRFGRVPSVLASEDRLSLVFLNLLLNAAHAIEEGNESENEIAIRTWAKGEDVFSEVSDTGRGIPPENLPRLFDPFFTTRELGTAAGLGLSIVRSIVSEFDGEISVDSDLGRGSRFTLRLRRAGGSVAEVQDTSRLAGAEPDPRCRVLVVDDEASIRAVIKRMLRHHEVVVASSGEEAKGLLEREPEFDVIFCDMMMPRMSGMDLHAWLVEHNPSLAQRLVFITGGVFTPKARAYLKGVDNPTLAKPFQVSTLRALIARRVRTAKHQR